MTVLQALGDKTTSEAKVSSLQLAPFGPGYRQPSLLSRPFGFHPLRVI
ncbi:hypothetical protein [uncultured Roseobacter sp.]|nr:hypothetical protein [uncultured Roseobacter sp.]